MSDDVVQVAEMARADNMESVQLHQFKTHTDNWGDMQVGTDHEVDMVLNEGCRPREYYLSAEREMSRPQPVTSAVAELSQVARASDERVYNIFGIPMAMFTQNSAGNNTGVNHLQEYVFNATVHQHKKCIEVRNQLTGADCDCMRVYRTWSTTSACCWDSRSKCSRRPTWQTTMHATCSCDRAPVYRSIRCTICSRRTYCQGRKRQT